MLGRYLALTIARRGGENSGINWVESSVTIGGLLLLASIFWLIGHANVNQVSFAGVFVVMLTGIGGWVGLRFVNTHRPNGYYFISKDVWLWSEAIKGTIAALIVSATTAVPYYIGLQSSQYSLVELIVFIKIVLVISLVFILIGQCIALIIRRLVSVKLARFSLIILAIFSVLSAVVTQLDRIKSMETSLLVNPATNIFLPTLLFFGGCVIVLTILVEAIFSKTPISSTPVVGFWGTRLRIIKVSSKPFVAAVVSSFLYALRSSALQRRLLTILLLLLVYPLLANFINIGSPADSVSAAILFGLIVTCSLSISLGQFASTQQTSFHGLPRSGKVHPLAELIASSIVLGVISLLFANLITPFPGVSGSLIIVITTLAAHTILFYASFLAAQLKQITNDKRGDALTLVALLIGLILVSLIINSYTILPVPVLAILIVLWSAVIAWILGRSAYYITATRA